MSKPNTTARRTRVERGIYTRPDGSYEIGFRDAAGKQRWRKVEGGIRAARSALAEAHAQRARGEKLAADPRLKFSDAAQAWWDARVVQLRPATQETYRGHLARLKDPNNFGRMRLTDITATDVAAYVARQRLAGLKGWTIRGQMTVLSSVFRYSARHLGFTGTNPVALLDRVERPSTDDEKAKRILNGEELSRLLAAVDDRHHLLFCLAAETGARLSEVLGLTWGDVDLQEASISFAFQLDRQGQRQQLKTRRSRRTVEVTRELAHRLKAHRGSSGYLADHDLVFTTRDGRGLDQRNVAGRALRAAVTRAGLEAVSDRNDRTVLPAPTFHSLRHSHASALIAAGWDIAEVSARLGHASIATTQRIYVHQFDAARRSSDRRDRLASLYSVNGAEINDAKVIRLDAAS